MLSLNQLNAARTFVLLNTRLIDRHRYSFLFEGGDAEPVLAALRPYQNRDGGFGHGLEPDGRGPESQPAHVDAALRVLDEIGRADDPMLRRGLDYLASVTDANGGVPVLLSDDYAEFRAPWWRAAGNPPPGSLLPTAQIAGLLHKNRVEHPWLAGATAFSWLAIAEIAETHPYEVQWTLTFLDNAPDRLAAEEAAARLGRLVRERRFVTLATDDPSQAHIPPGYAPGEIHTPLDYAPRPSNLARRWFSDVEIAADLDALERAQGDDGGWSFTWRQWNHATTLEWRAAITIHYLLILREYGRLPNESARRETKTG